MVTCNVSVGNNSQRMYPFGMTKGLKLQKKAKHSYRHGDLKEALIQAAVSSITKSGEIEFSLRDLAEKVGVSHAAAYRHFSSKKEILFEIAHDGFLKLNQAFAAILEKEASDIVSLGVAYVKYAIENPIHFKIMFHPDLKIDVTHPELISVGSQTFLSLKNCVENNKRAGKFGDDSVEDLSIAAWSLVHGLAILAVNGNLKPLPDGTSVSSDTIAVKVACILVNGLRKR